MSRKKTANTGWESDEEDLLGDGGISAFKTEDDEIDEAALLGLVDDVNNYAHGEQLSEQEHLEQTQEELLEIGVDEAEIEELVVDDSGYFHEAQPEVLTAKEEEEQEQLDYDDDMPQADEGVQVHYDEDLGVMGEAEGYAELSHDDAGIMEHVPDSTTSYLENQNQEGIAHKESDSDSDSDSEKQGERGRFKNERPNIVSISKAKSRTDIPDTLEVSAEQQTQINKFPEGNRQRGRFHNNRGPGQRSGNRRGGQFDSRIVQSRGMAFGVGGGLVSPMMSFGRGQMVPRPGLMGQLPIPREMSPGGLPNFRNHSPGGMMFRDQPETRFRPPQSLLHLQQTLGPRLGHDFGMMQRPMGQQPQRGPSPLFPPGMQVRPPQRLNFPLGQQQHPQQFQQQQLPPQMMGQQQQQRMPPPMMMQESAMKPVTPLSAAPRPHNIHINPNFRKPGPGSSMGQAPKPLFFQAGVRMDDPRPLIQGQSGVFQQQQAMNQMGPPANADFHGQQMMVSQQYQFNNNQGQMPGQQGQLQRGVFKRLSVYQRLQPLNDGNQQLSDRGKMGANTTISMAKRLSQQARLTQQAKLAAQNITGNSKKEKPVAALKRQSTDSHEGATSPKVPKTEPSADENPADAELRKGLEEQKRLREMIQQRKEEARRRQAELRRKELEERLKKEGKSLADLEGEQEGGDQHAQPSAQPVPQQQPSAQRISTVISRAGKKQTLAPARRPSQQQQQHINKMYDQQQQQLAAQQTQYEQQEALPFPHNQNQFGSQQQLVHDHFVLQPQAQQQQFYAGPDQVALIAQGQEYQSPLPQLHLHQQQQQQQQPALFTAHGQPVFHQQPGPEMPPAVTPQYPPPLNQQQYQPPPPQLAYQSPPPQQVQLVRPQQPPPFRPQQQQLLQQQRQGSPAPPRQQVGMVRQQFQPRPAPPQNQAHFPPQLVVQQQPPQQQLQPQPDFPKPGEPMTNAQRIQLLNSGQSILGASRGRPRGLVPSQVVSVISNRRGQAGRGQGPNQQPSRGLISDGGQVLVGRGPAMTQAVVSAAGTPQVQSNRTVLPVGRGMGRARGGSVVSAPAGSRTIQQQIVHQNVPVSAKTMTVYKISIDNFTKGTSAMELRKLGETVGNVLDIVMIESQQKAIMTFDNQSSAVAFFKLFNRRMIGLSMVTVKLLP